MAALMGMWGWVLALSASTTLVSIIVVIAQFTGLHEALIKRVAAKVTAQLGLEFSASEAYVEGWWDGYVALRNVSVQSSDGARERNEPVIDLRAKTMLVRLSLRDFMEGGGIVKELHVQGVQGVIDRRHVRYAPASYDERDAPSAEMATLVQQNGQEPKRRRRRRRWTHNNFDLRACSLKDASVTIRNPNPDRPLHLSLFSVQLPRLRQQWLLFDILSADHINGSFDGSLLAVHRAQHDDPVHSHHFRCPHSAANLMAADAARHLIDEIDAVTGGSEERRRRKRKRHQALKRLERRFVSVDSPLSAGGAKGAAPQEQPRYIDQHIRIDGINIDLLSKTTTGPLNWLTRGRMGLHVCVRVPVEHKHTSSAHAPELVDDELIKVNVDVELRNLNAELPLVVPELSYVENIGCRPLVAFMNTNYTELPLSFVIPLQLSDFDGAWFPGDAGLYTSIGNAVGAEISALAQRETSPDRLRFFATVVAAGIWRGFIVLADRFLDWSLDAAHLFPS
jgi:mitochondrial distribution and morphology protein 31